MHGEASGHLRDQLATHATASIDLALDVDVNLDMDVDPVVQFRLDLDVHLDLDLDLDLNSSVSSLRSPHRGLALRVPRDAPGCPP
jgi:hypothetical protein